MCLPKDARVICVRRAQVGGEAETVLERTPAGIRLADGTTWSKLSFGPFNQRLQEQYGTSAGQQLLPQYASGS